MDISPYDFMDSPPLSNRGVRCTSKSDLVPLLDWVSITFKNRHIPLEIAEYFNIHFSYFNTLPNGLYGYKTVKNFNGLFMMYSPDRLEMGTHLQVTGQGCRYLESIPTFDWLDFFNWLNQYDINITRLDLAIDDLKGYFTTKDILKKIKNGEVVSPFRKSINIEEIKLNTGETLGQTIYFGRASGQVQIRIYDKKAERESKGLTYDVEHWVRTEIQLKDDRALNAFNKLVDDMDNLSNLILSILNRYISIRTKNKTDTNRRRWNVWHKWAKFIGDVGKTKLATHPVDRGIDDKIIWIDKYVAPTLKLLDMAGIPLEDIVNNAKLKDNHIQMLKEFMYKKRDLINRSHDKNNIT